ncbi:hypothetical protein ABW02_13160 [Niallia circulans]|uniref:Uncharacterized protein n=1 Tax=Niallia circulans TaxID=1397 RepID=A0A0J1IJ97_NIACI|nr:hypothetical protein ABW02_13160 [Niallia circulans]
MSSAPFHSVFKDYLVPAFFSKENKTEQTEYTETPMGAARKSKTPQFSMRRSGSALAPWKAQCIQSAGDYHKPSFLK